ncbi:MAG: hypothetical protein NZ959_05785 [Armatimonadetes bacterium]|nr:hypothetical protein [Armatimonadota bacterium]MDW8122437.1 hypothetical protein [Armatimonadota bacterium]
MAKSAPAIVLTFPAAADLSNYQFAPVTLDSNGQVTVASDNQISLGILQNKPKEGGAASVMVSGVSKAIAAQAITAPLTPLVSAGNGRVRPASSYHTHTENTAASYTQNATTQPAQGGSFIIGYALRSASVAGEVIEVLLAPFRF